MPIITAVKSTVQVSEVNDNNRTIVTAGISDLMTWSQERPHLASYSTLFADVNTS